MGTKKDDFRVGLTTVFHVTDWQSTTYGEEVLVSIKGVCSLGWQGERKAALEFRLGTDDHEQLHELIARFPLGSYHKVESAYFTVYPDEIGFDEPQTKRIEKPAGFHSPLHHLDTHGPIVGALAPLPLQRVVLDSGLMIAEMACGKSLTHLRERDLRAFFEPSYSRYFSFSNTTRNPTEIKIFIQRSVRQVMAVIDDRQNIYGALMRLVGPETFFADEELLVDHYLREALQGRFDPERIFVSLKVDDTCQDLTIDLILCA